MIVLFDIDGTLLDAHGAGRRAMVDGFRAVTDRPDGFADIRFAGMTDPSIVRAGLRAEGLPEDADVIERVIAAYLERLPAQLEARPPRVLGGVVAVLEWLAECSEVALGVGTGNVEAGARAKLRAAGLDPWFEFGGYGSDHELRAELLRAGALRGAQQLGVAEGSAPVIVIGDTPRDVAAAHAIGAECLAVATSHYDETALYAAGPSAVVPGLDAAPARAWLQDRVGLGPAG